MKNIDTLSQRYVGLELVAPEWSYEVMTNSFRKARAVHTLKISSVG